MLLPASSASATHDLVGEGHNVHTTMHQTTSERDGGGVLMYAQHNLIVNVLPSQLQYNVPHNLEFLPISVKHNKFRSWNCSFLYATWCFFTYFGYTLWHHEKLKYCSFVTWRF